MSLGNNGFYSLSVLLTIHQLEPKAYKARIYRELDGWWSLAKLQYELYDLVG